VSIQRQFGLGSILRVVALAVSTGIALRLSPFVVHTLGDHNYGLWTLVATLGTYYGLLDLGLSAAVSRHLTAALGSHQRGSANQIVSTALAMYLFSGSLVFIASISIALLARFSFHSPAELAIFQKLVLICGASTGLTVPARVFFGILNANLRFDLSAAIDIFSSVLRASLIYVILLGGANVTALAWINLSVAILSASVAFLLCRRASPHLEFRPVHIGRTIAKKLIHYGSISMVAQVADLLRFQVDALVVAGFLGIAAVTHYSIAGSLTQYFISLMLAATGTLGPVFSRLEASGDSERMRQTLNLGTKVTVALATFVCFGLLAWGRPFIVCWMGPQYLDAYPPLVALTLGATVALWQTTSLHLLYGISKHGLFAIFNSAEGVANLAISLLLVRRFGLLGVALGTMIPMMVTKLFVQPWYVCRAANLNLFEFYGVLGKALLAALAALLLPAFLTVQFAGPDLGRLFALAVASIACYVPVVYLLLFDHRERRLLLSIVPAGSTAASQAASAGGLT